MGVHGLWKLIDSSGKAIPLEALENRVLAVDVSIWLYQLVKGIQEVGGYNVANAYLLGLFHRICKLLFYRIKPIFVFDGGVPALKRRTIAERQNSRTKANRLGEKLRQSLLENLAKQEALGQVLGESVILPKLFQPKQDTLFQLPPLPATEEIIRNESSDSEDEKEKFRYKDIHSIDITSEEFLSLPPDMRHDILNELKETRKQNSWSRLHLIPKESNEFSDYQMKRLLKRRAVQVGIEQAESEMGTRGFTLSDLQNILSEQGVELAQRIAADSSTRLLYNSKIKDLVNDVRDINKESSHTITTNPPPTTEEARPGPSTSRLLKKNNASSTTKRLKKPKLTIHYEDDELSEVDPLYLSSSGTDSDQNEGFTQKEILQLIKQENQKEILSQKSSVGEVFSSGSIETKNAKLEKQEALTVNGEAVENEAEDNAAKLEHGSLPRESISCQQLSPCSEDELSSQSQFSRTSQELREMPSKTQESAGDKEQLYFNSNKISQDNILETIVTRDLEPVIKINKDKSKERLEILNLLMKQKEDMLSPMKEPCLPSNITDVESKALRMHTIETSANLKSSEEESDDDFVEVNMDTDEGNMGADESNMGTVESSDSKENSSLPANLPKEIISSTPVEILINIAHPLDDDLFTDVFKNPSGHIKDIPSASPGKQLDSSNTNSTPSLEKVPKSRIIMSDEEQIKENLDRYQEMSQLDESSEFIENLDISVNIPEKAQLPVSQLSVEEIVKMKKLLERETSDLMRETSREERIASTITEQLRLDAQELLQLFGVPYIIAPMEAEAQCAYLDLAGQTQGTITDDSDIWLFGGNNVYKNFFDQKKFVQQFKASDITRLLHIGRDEMIMLALLTGSDYTLGLTGVGAVTALEVVAHYPRTDNEPSPSERLRHFAKDFCNHTLFDSIAKKLKKASVYEGFPSVDVINAYLDPEVDNSSEKFTWSKPNLNELRRYCHNKFGWDKTRTDKVLEPILENLNKTQTQGTLHSFFEWKFDAAASAKSKRVENAINIIKTGTLPADPGPSIPRRLRKGKTDQGPNIPRPPLKGNLLHVPEKNLEIPVKSKTPAQIARERAAKKFKELKKQGKVGNKTKKK